MKKAISIDSIIIDCRGEPRSSGVRGWPELKFVHDVANGDLLTFRVLRGALSFSVSAIHLPVDHSIHPSTPLPSPSSPSSLTPRLTLPPSVHQNSPTLVFFLRPHHIRHYARHTSTDNMGMAQILGLGLRGFQVCAPPPTSSTAPHHTNDPRSSSCPCSSWPSSETPSPWEPTHPSTITPCFAPHSPCYVSSS